jgi:hypothetical protein
LKTASLEQIVADVILSFCENLAELGCPRNAEPDIWFRELSNEERFKIADKLIDIEQRYEEEYAKDKIDKKIKKTKIAKKIKKTRKIRK